jgi:hypothetical protein
LGSIVVDIGDDVDVLVDQFIINSSLFLLIPKDGLKSQAFLDVVSLSRK